MEYTIGQRSQEKKDKPFFSRVWRRIKYWFRSWIYPRNFDVILKRKNGTKSIRLPFQAIDKSEDTGRFIGDCKETITLEDESYDRVFNFWNLIKLAFKSLK